MNRTTRGSVAAASVIALAFLGACSSGGSGGTGTGSTSGSGSGQGTETLTLARFSGPWSDALVGVAKQFTEETGIQVHVDAVDYAQLQQKQILNMQGKTGEYDVVYVPENWYQQYIDAGYLSPLDDLLSDPAVAGDGFSFDDFNPTALGITTGEDGKVYGLPDSMQTDLICYDKDAFASAGLAEPTTWDTLLAAAKHFKEQGTGIAVPARQGTAIADMLITVARGNGADLFTADGKLDLTNDKVVEAAAYLQELMTYSLEGSTSWHYDETTKALQFGQAPLGVCLSGLASATEDPSQSKVAGKLAYQPMAYHTDLAGYMLTWNYSVTADSKHQEDAARFVAWLTSNAAQKAMVKAYPGPASLRNDLADDSELAASAPWLGAVKEGLDNAATPPLGASAQKLMDALGAALNGMFVNGTAPKDALSSVQDALAGDF